MRQFPGGATRSTDDGKIDPEGAMSPLVIERFCQYMAKMRHLDDGSIREDDNWQLGIPNRSAIKSGLRHVFTWWRIHRGWPCQEDLEETLCAVIFNAQIYLHNLLASKLKQGE